MFYAVVSILQSLWRFHTKFAKVFLWTGLLKMRGLDIINLQNVECEQLMRRRFIAEYPEESSMS